MVEFKSIHAKYSLIKSHTHTHSLQLAFFCGYSISIIGFEFFLGEMVTKWRKTNEFMNKKMFWNDIKINDDHRFKRPTTKVLQN